MVNSSDERLKTLINTIKNQADEVFSEIMSTSKDSNSEYSSIEEYTKKTGKRFRMTKNQTDRGLTREEAFFEFLKNRK